MLSPLGRVDSARVKRSPRSAPVRQAGARHSAISCREVAAAAAADDSGLENPVVCVAGYYALLVCAVLQGLWSGMSSFEFWTKEPWCFVGLFSIKTVMKSELCPG